MRIRKPHMPTGPGVNITPLSDIMLSLLIFFMLVSRAGVDTGADLEMVLPEVSAATEEELTQESAANTIVLNLYAGVTGGEVTEIRTLPPLATEPVMLTISPNVDELQPYLARQIAANPDLSVVLRADQGTEYRYLEPVLKAAAAAKVGQIKWAVVEEVDQ
jgi:biopolymer transport protein ExbD